MPACTGPDAGCRLGLETASLIKREFSFPAVKGGRAVTQRGAYETGRSAETPRKAQSTVTGGRGGSAAGLGPPALGVRSRCQAPGHAASTEHHVHAEQRRGGTRSTPSPLPGVGDMWGSSGGSLWPFEGAAAPRLAGLQGNLG